MWVVITDDDCFSIFNSHAEALDWAEREIISSYTIMSINHPKSY